MANDFSICRPRKFNGASFALQAGAGTVSNPTMVRRNTIRHIGPSAGVKVSKNTLAELNHMYDERDIQLDGSLLQGGGHDLFEISERSVPATSGNDRFGVFYQYLLRTHLVSFMREFDCDFTRVADFQ
eukprot:COSAG01_NODE_634_length_14664_cov_22.808376_5_plen_128_part_00